MSLPADRWADLRVRVVSGVVLIALGAVATFEGGLFFRSMVLVVFSVMIWELAGMNASPHAPLHLGLAGVAALCLLALMTVLPPPAGLLVLVLPPLGLLLTPRRDAGLIAGYALLILLSGAGFLALRHQGALVFLWLVLVVVISDTLGYFAGRMLGGPKFWPRVSPKKTWSGTVAGWAGATLIGLVFVASGAAGWSLLIFSPLVAFAGQMGDILESWIKRRAGVKDASGLIPGHGGVLDRFDALVGAVLAVIVISWVIPLPFPVVG
jgi:phosphatidate cytidylyltransferase